MIYLNWHIKLEAETKLIILHITHNSCRNNCAEHSPQEADSRWSIQECHFLFHSINIYRYLLTYLLTPWSRVLLEKLTGSAVSQEIPRILCNPKVPHSTHKCPPPVPISSQLHPIPTTPSHFLKIHLNIILPSTSGSPQWFLSLRFPHQNHVHTSPLPHTHHMPRPSHSSRFTTRTILCKDYRALSSSLCNFLHSIFIVAFTKSCHWIIKYHTLLQTHFNIILPITPTTTALSLSFRFA